MITKNDCYLLLAELSDNGVDTTAQTKELMRSSSTPLSVITFINKNRQLDLAAFYEKLRRSYNNKKSNLYINIVKEVEDTSKVLTTLSALLTQLLIFSKDASNREMFLKHARMKEIAAVLHNYAINYDLIPCIKLTRIIKADLKAMEAAK